MLKQKNEKFEKDCLAVFEQLLQGYKRAKESNVWQSNLNKLVNKITHFPTDPFSIKLMRLFDYDYLVQSDNIESIIEKSLIVRDQMKHTERFLTISEKYFPIPFVPSDKRLKKLEVYNSNGELCYAEKRKIQVKTRNLLLWIFIRRRKFKLKDMFSIKHQLIEKRSLKIYYYSEHINLSITNKKAYYNFFCDYYGKLKFISYIDSNKVNNQKSIKLTGITSINKASSFRQVVLANSMFSLIGLKLRENLDTSSLAKFLLLINNSNNLNDYKNSYYYKLAGKLHQLDSEKYLHELKFTKEYFRKNNLPTQEIDREIKKYNNNKF